MQLITHTYNNNSNTTKAVIALHGWTGDEYVFEPIAKMLKINNAEWFFPRAPYKADSRDGNSWFSGNEKSGWHYKKTMRGLDNLVKKILDQGYTKENLFFIGFSQGACLAIEYALRMSFSIGGIVPIAGFIKFKEKLIEEMSTKSKSTKILLLHGEEDKLVSINESYSTFDILKEMGYNVKLKTYNAGHKIPIACLSFIKNFIE